MVGGEPRSRRGRRRDAQTRCARGVALVGIFGGADGRHALVQLPNGDTERVRAGDEVQGVQVTAIAADGVRLSARGGDTVLVCPIERAGRTRAGSGRRRRPPRARPFPALRRRYIAGRDIGEAGCGGRPLRACGWRSCGAGLWACAPAGRRPAPDPGGAGPARA